MSRNKKKILIVLMLIGFLFLTTGCTIPTDESGKYIQITSDTTFQSMINSEGWFSALFVYPLAKAINILTPLFPSSIGVALSIALVTAGINIIILLLTFKSNVQQQRMTEIQPEINRITKKYEGKTDEQSKMRQAQEMQALYKKYDINIFGTLLTTFIQFPVLIAVYQAVQRSQAVATGSFLGMSLEVSPMSGVMDGQWGFLILFLVMLAAQFGSMKLPQFLANHQAKKEAEKHHRKYVPTKQAGGNMMYGMMAVIMVLAVTWPAAMTIYWIISSLVQIAKTLIVRKITQKSSTKTA